MYNHELATIDTMARVLDITSLRHRVLADNLANANTPDFIRSDVDFLDELRQAVDSGDKSQLSDVEAVVKRDKFTPMRPDGNNVQIQKELGGMMENQLLYNFAARAVQRKFAGLKKAIAGV